MKQAVLSVAFAAALMATTTIAFAADQTSSSPSMPKQIASTPNQNLARQQAMENQAQKAFNAGINPLANFQSSGVYDQADAYKGPNGFMLPGTYMNGGDSNAMGGS